MERVFKMNKIVDVIIIGGGLFGLNVVLVFGRVRKEVVVIDEGWFCNMVICEIYGFLIRDGVIFSEFC